MTTWALARAAGYGVLLAATLSLVLGAASSRRAPVAARTVRTLVHRSTSVLVLLLLAVHAAAVVADSFVTVAWWAALVPFASSYERLPLALGTLASWGFVLAASSGALRGRLARWSGAARGWRAVHATAYGAWVLAVVHGLLSGTDTGAWWSWTLYAACAAAGATAVLVGLLARRQRSAPPSRPRSAAPVPRPVAPAGGLLR